MNKLLLTLGTFFYSTSLLAQIQFNEITYSGSGCPQGTVSTAVSPDNSTLSVLFDEFRTEVPQYDGRNDNEELPRGQRNRVRRRNTPSVSYKVCSLGFTAVLPPGTKADALDISLQARGVAILDPEIEGSFSSQLVGYQGLARSNGKPSMIIQKNWVSRPGGVEDEWTSLPRSQVNLHSGCSGAQGRTIRFDIRNTISLEILSENLQRRGLLTVDSADMTGMLKFTLRTRPCGGNK